ncbi:hypothetical protein AXE41_RS06365 [Acinetobacter baumannii]|uniref:DUF7660 domain-containing protein n=1 Tax=Acinetobacter baumannii TaxID=470 RepID=A0AAQ0WIF6_ACIBA|nr:hypothetical protein [Acinetobacter baumannii]EHU1704571.1 hypothetical protein [Acinetobacter baumannii]EHU1923433.1 hypothetical protein [Acinetobacter baumannii]EHU1988190.1 hypothetical protein [Acinetobacter baumannii]EHU2638105.1 hypothetical protein [Acinetobacter baumannii]EHU3101367.1 hypothetical protein [Acinetobacter baumannii]
MNKLNEKVQKINTKEDFLEFVQLLVNDLSKNQWENDNLADYLEGINSWVDDMDGYFENVRDYDALEKIKNNQLDWKILGKILLAATMYE